jgi:hypothetical protein
MYYAHYNEEGIYTGFYLEDLHGNNIPTPNIVLTPQEWSQALTGDYRVIDGLHTYSPINISEEETLANTLVQVRGKRDALLLSSDWTQLADSPLSSTKKTQWKTYRQQLRDITNSADISNVEFPTPPL